MKSRGNWAKHGGDGGKLGWEKIGKLGIGCEARQRVENWGEAQSMIPA